MKKPKNNPVAKNMNKFNKPKTFVDKKKQLKRGVKSEDWVQEYHQGRDR